MFRQRLRELQEQLTPTAYDTFLMADALASLDIVDQYTASSEIPALRGHPADEEQLFSALTGTDQESTVILSEATENTVGEDPTEHTATALATPPHQRVPARYTWYRFLGEDEAAKRRRRDLEAMQETYDTMEETMAVQFDGKQPRRQTTTESAAPATSEVRTIRVRRTDPNATTAPQTTVNAQQFLQPLLQAPQQIAIPSAPNLTTVQSRLQTTVPQYVKPTPLPPAAPLIEVNVQRRQHMPAWVWFAIVGGAITLLALRSK